MRCACKNSLTDSENANQGLKECRGTSIDCQMNRHMLVYIVIHAPLPKLPMSYQYLLYLTFSPCLKQNGRPLGDLPDSSPDSRALAGPVQGVLLPVHNVKLVKQSRCTKGMPHCTRFSMNDLKSARDWDTNGCKKVLQFKCSMLKYLQASSRFLVLQLAMLMASRPTMLPTPIHSSPHPSHW